MDDVTRYQIRFRGKAQELLRDMCTEMKATPKDVILDALAVLHFAMDAVREGDQVGRFNAQSEQFTAIITPSLQQVADARKKAARPFESRGA